MGSEELAWPGWKMWGKKDWRCHSIAGHLPLANAPKKNPIAPNLWNEESLMVYNLERKQKELKCLHEYLLRWFNFNVAPVSTSPRSTIDLGKNNYSNDKYPPASDFRICTKLRTFAVPVLRCSGILLFRCSGVPVFRVPLFLVLL